MQNFKALRVHNEEGNIQARIERINLSELNAGEVVIKATWSDINYKDALAVTGAGKILRRYPLVAGIDVAGTVAASDSPEFKEGDDVLVTGCNLSETVDGGYAEYVRVAANAVVKCPPGLGLKDAMLIGTAGFTAALAVHRMEQNGQTPDHGPIAVTGPTGGVGGIAIDILASRGYDVTAITGKPDSADYLKSLGANEIVHRQSIEFSTRPLERSQWGGAIDNLGGEMLSWLTRTTHDFGNVASIGLAADHKLSTTVMPFILRGINLLGINSVTTPRPLRLQIWDRLATDLHPQKLQALHTRTVTLDELPSVMPDYLQSNNFGRTLVAIR